ncbi:MAG: helix-turn-helix transcriptional regulator [Clostridia bacterium]|nr:helix-turn-helix transcriptional regulator [Clostridia bacterium]
MLTDFGRFLRKIRIDYGEILKDMADKLNVSAAYLSAVEMGKRNIPEQWVDKISQLYNLSEEEKSNLKNVADSSAKSITLSFENISNSRKETAILFAREFENVDAETLDKIKKLLRNTEE